MSRVTSYINAMLEAKTVMPVGPIPPLGQDREWAKFVLLYQHKAVSVLFVGIRLLKFSCS